MPFEADVLRIGRDIDVKVFDTPLFYHFTVRLDGIDYEIVKDMGGELIARTEANLVDLQETDGYLTKLLISTNTHLFEILPNPERRNYYVAYKQLRKIA